MADDLSSQRFYQGTKADLKPGDLIEPGYDSNYGKRKKAAYRAGARSSIGMCDPYTLTAFLFTDIEEHPAWDRQPERMRPALARRAALARSAVEGHRGTVVKMRGNGLCAAFDDGVPE